MCILRIKTTKALNKFMKHEQIKLLSPPRQRVKTEIRIPFFSGRNLVINEADCPY